MLVIDVPPDSLKFTEELWLGMGGAKRFMAWGKFDKFNTAVLPAKELRALIRVKGVASSSEEYKTQLLRRKIQGSSTTRPVRRTAEARPARQRGALHAFRIGDEPNAEEVLRGLPANVRNGERIGHCRRLPRDESLAYRPS